MAFLDEMFDHMMDSEYRQRRDIRSLQQQVVDMSITPTVTPQVVDLMQRVNQLELLANALVSVIENKRLATREELEVMVQQLDLLDGREDGKIQSAQWHEAPRCGACNRYVNPNRQACVYCGRSLEGTGAMVGGPYRGGGSGEAAPAPRTAKCGVCSNVVPQAETVFNGDGVLECDDCRTS